jgi:WD40 repeat protein
MVPDPTPQPEAEPAEWFYARNRQKVGPLTLTQLRELLASGEVSRQDMVLRHGSGKWMQASAVPELNTSSAAPVPMAMPVAPTARPVKAAPTMIPSVPSSLSPGFVAFEPSKPSPKAWLSRFSNQLYEVWNWCRQHPIVAALLGAVFLVLLNALLVTLFRLERLSADARIEADALVARAAAMAEELEQVAKQMEAQNQLQAKRITALVYANQINRAWREWQDNNIIQARQLLEVTPEEQRGWEYGCLRHLIEDGHQTLAGHTGGITNMACSSDGKRLATASRDQTVKVWDTDTGAVQLTLKGHTAAVLGVAFSPDGKTLASTSAAWDRQKEDWTGGEIKVWDSTNDKETLTLQGGASGILCMAFSPDGQRLAGGAGDGTIKLWDCATGQVVTTINAHALPVRCVAFSRDSQRLASGSGEYHYRGIPGEIKLWNPSNGQEALAIKGQSGSLYSIAFSPDGLRLASAAGAWNAKREEWQASEMNVWDTKTGQEAIVCRNKEGGARPHGIVCVAFSPDGKRLAGGSAELADTGWCGDVHIWDMGAGQEVLNLRGHTAGVHSLLFLPGTARLATGSADKTAKVWDSNGPQECRTLRGHKNPVNSIAFSPDGKRLASADGSFDQPGEVKIWVLLTEDEFASLKGHGSWISCVAFSPDGKRLATASADQKVKVGDADNGQELLTFKGHGHLVTCVAFSPDGKVLASCDGATVKVWDSRTGNETFKLEGVTGGESLVFSPDGQRLAACGSGTVILWDMTTGKTHSRFVSNAKDMKAPFSCLAFSPDGKHLAVSATDLGSRVRENPVTIREVDGGQQPIDLRGHSEAVRCLAFSPDGKRLASASDDRTIKIWDVSTGQELLTLKGHGREVTSVAFSSDGRWLASGSVDQTVKLWEASRSRK